MAEIIILLEKKRKNVTHDGTVKEILEKAAHLRSRLLSMISPWDEEEVAKDSPGLKEEESLKDSPEWKVKSEEVAASEQGISKGKDRSNSLPRSNKKRKLKTCSNKFAVIEPKYIYRLIVYLILIGTLVSGANGKDPCTSNPCANGSCTRLTSETYSCTCAGGYAGVNCEQDINECESNPCQSGGTCVDGLGSYTCNCAKGYNGAICQNIYLEEGKFRKIIIATNETQIATDPIKGQNGGSIFMVVAKDGNDREIFKADSDFVTKNQSCSIRVGDRNKTECKGLRISGNAFSMYLAVDGSKLTHARTRFYIFQQVPLNYALYILDVFKNQEQAPKTNRCEVAFYILLIIVLVILLVIAIAIAIAIKKNFPCILEWCEKESMRRVPVRTSDPDPDQNATTPEDFDPTSIKCAP